MNERLPNSHNRGCATNGANDPTSEQRASNGSTTEDRRGATKVCQHLEEGAAQVEAALLCLHQQPDRDGVNRQARRREGDDAQSRQLRWVEH